MGAHPVALVPAARRHRGRRTVQAAPNEPWSLEDVHSIPGTNCNKLVAIAAGHHTLAAGPVVIITPSEGMNDSRAIRIVTLGVYPPEGGMSGSPVDEGGVADHGGFYMTPWPLSQKYFLGLLLDSPARRPSGPATAST